MALLVFNLTGADITLAGTGVVVPASDSPPDRGESVNVTSEIRALNGGQLDAIEAQRAGALELIWTSKSEFDTGNLVTTDTFTNLETLTIATRLIHEPIVAAAKSVSKVNQGPEPDVFGTLIVLKFTPNTHSAYRLIKIPSSYIGDSSFHVHWTKSADVDEATKTVKWKISYLVFDGSSGNAAAPPNVIEAQDTYDGSTTDGTRIVYRTGDLAATGFVAGYYLSIKVEAITPTGTPLANDPALVSVDMIYRGKINEGN